MSIHSRYNPVKEAERFIDACEFTYIPYAVIVSEPGESYIAPILRTRFPDTHIIALRYDSALFSESDELWDAVWRPGDKIALESFLFNQIPDEYLPLTMFIPWKPADREWPDVAVSVWTCIASMIKTQTDIMYTRNKFGKRWLENMVINAIGIRTAIHSSRTSKPVFLAAAGPSLEKQFPFRQGAFYICAVSSALSCLKRNDCVPDLCIATDGGYWARELFIDLPDDIPVAFPLEASISPTVHERNPAVLLNYGSALETKILALMGIDGEPAVRNGTVAGTAAHYLLSHTTNRVYAAGLDLEISTSFPHARPHSANTRVETATNRFAPLSSRFYSDQRTNASLAVYAAWFSSRNETFRSRFFRLRPEGRKIDGIATVSLANIATPSQTEKNHPVKCQNLQSIDSRKNSILAMLDDFRSMISQCIDIGDPDEKINAFSHGVLVNLEHSELMQMIAYTDYINILKKTRMIPEEQALSVLSLSDLIGGICSKADEFTMKLAEKIKRYG